MDYGGQQKIKRGQIDYDVKIGLPYGEMPPEALMSKFEQTNDYIDCDEIYNDYARDTLVDRSPDAATFAYEEPRRSFNGKGFLNLMHSGSRGSAQFVGHPEAFLELTETEPRGTATDPDYKQLKRQHEERMRFVRFSSDADNSITGGGWNEGQLQQARQTMFKNMKPRMRQFTTSKDGRREGMHRMWEAKSEVGKVLEQERYGDTIKDYALVPQRDTVKLSNTILRNTRLYHQFTSDHEFHVAKYGDFRRTARRLTGIDKKVTDADYTFDDQDLSRCYKAAGCLMGKIVNQKREAETDAEHGHHVQAVSRKNEIVEAKKDLNVIMYAIEQETEQGDQDINMTTKTAPQQTAKHLAEVTETNHLTPAHVKLNGQLMFKAVQPNADINKIRENMVVDPQDPKICDLLKESRTRYGKNAEINTNPGARYSKFEVNGKTLNAPTFKSKAPTNPSAKSGVDDEPYAVAKERYGASGMVLGDDNSHVRGSNKARHTNPSVSSTITNIDFLNNTSKERRLAPMGDKFKIHRYSERDADRDEISSMS
jgi:hypothetical protein